MTQSDPDERLGSVLDGRYRLLQRISEGSMGVVYRAERVPVGKPVAVKFLHTAFASDPEFLLRFERETRVMSKLAHPHCVSVVDFGVAGAPYMVMDFVTGTTLREILDDSPLPLSEALSLMRQLLAGLAHAHAQGIVHRDVKPANIMVSEEIGTGPHVRVLDFGLARLRGAAATSVTQSCVVVGTPNYMAPEQTVGGEVDARTDLYAAGVILFEMVTGRRPFSAPDTLELFNMHRQAPVPRLRDVAPTLMAPAGLDDVIRRALAKEPAKRFASAVEFAEALEEVSERVEGASRRAGTRASTFGLRRPSSSTPVIAARRKSRAALMVLAGAAAAVGLAWIALRDGGTAKKRQQPAVIAIDAAPSSTAAVSRPSAPAVAAPPSIVPVVANELIDAAIDPPAVDPSVLSASEVVDAAIEPAPAVVIDAGIEPVEPDAAVAPAPGTDVAVIPAEPTEDPDLPVVAAGDGESEAPDAPATAADAEAREAAQAAPAPARSIAEAMVMIKRGQRAQAMAGLRGLWKKNPRNGHLPYLIGNLYFDRKWWSVAIDHYRAAIARAPGYRSNPILIRNVIHALGSRSTRGKASWFLTKTVGRPARPYLKAAARRDPSPAVRQSSSYLFKRIR